MGGEIRDSGGFDGSLEAYALLFANRDVEEIIDDYLRRMPQRPPAGSLRSFVGR